MLWGNFARTAGKPLPSAIWPILMNMSLIAALEKRRW